MIETIKELIINQMSEITSIEIPKFSLVSQK